MTAAAQKMVFRLAGGTLGALGVFFVLLMHNSWGDDRYQSNLDAVAMVDVMLNVQSIHILYAESEQEKNKHEAIQEVWERYKEAISQ